MLAHLGGNAPAGLVDGSCVAAIGYMCTTASLICVSVMRSNGPGFFPGNECRMIAAVPKFKRLASLPVAGRIGFA
jgi:hypothetical protein